MSGHSYLSLCKCGFSAKRSYYNRYTINQNCKMSRLTHLRRSVIQHNIRHPMYSGTPMNNILHITANDIINIELQNTTDTGFKNIRNFTTYCKCKLRQKQRLRHENYSNKDTAQEIDLQNQTIYQRGNYEEEYEYPEMNVGNLETKMKNLEINSENFTLEFDPETYSEYDENKSEFNEKTEKDLQGNDELNVVYYSNDYEYIIEPTYILDKNEETAVPNTKEKIKIEILENIIIKPATSESNDDLLQTSDADLLETSNDSSIPEEIQTVIAQETNVEKRIDDERISVRKDEMLESSEDFFSKQTNNNAKVDETEPIASTSKETTTRNTANKTKDSEKGNLAYKSNYTNTKKVPQFERNLTNKSDHENVEKVSKFDNFKVPKKVTLSKKIIVKKQQPRFILTHVVEGYIIQESNFAFPIRKLQSQRTKSQTSTKSTTKESAPTEIKEDKVDQEESRTEEPVPPTEVKEEEIDQEEKIPIDPASDAEVKDEIVDQEESATVEPVPLTELLIEVKEEETDLKEESMTEETVKQETADQGENKTIEPGPPIEVKDEKTELKKENITEEPVPPTEVKEEMKEELPNGESNPFARLQQSTVRAWTVEDLLNHLQKFNWEETAALLEDNEIDGEALFMVTKSQLMIVGINEEQAEVICEFIQSGSSGGN